MILLKFENSDSDQERLQPNQEVKLLAIGTSVHCGECAGVRAMRWSNSFDRTLNR